MLSLSPATRIFVALEAVDLRQSFNGLSARVQSVLAQDPLSGHLFFPPFIFRWTPILPSTLLDSCWERATLWWCRAG